MSAGINPRELVSLLDEVFSAFDTMVEGRGLEKIKTMESGGIPGSIQITEAPTS